MLNAKVGKRGKCRKQKAESRKQKAESGKLKSEQKGTKRTKGIETTQ